MKTIYYWRLSLITAALLCIPLVAMLFTTEVNWSFFDFALMGALIFGTGSLYGEVARRLKHKEYKLATAIAVGTTFFLIWINLAVGLVGSGPNVANVLYMFIPMVVIVGFTVYSKKPRALAMTMFAAAAAQILVPVIALGVRHFQGLPVMEAWVNVLGITGMFVALWTTSALLFLQLGQKQSA